MPSSSYFSKTQTWNMFLFLLGLKWNMKVQVLLNTSHVVGVSRRQVQNITFFFFKIVKFGDHIWNHNEKCIQISTNMPSIGAIINFWIEKGFEFEKFWGKKEFFCMVKQVAKVFKIMFCILQVKDLPYFASIEKAKIWNFTLLSR